jgi:hypothetical protein
MRTFIASLLTLLFTTQAHAGGCPDFFRFVDFGLQDQSGDIHRGGLLFRAFNSEGEHLLRSQGTDCRAVDFLAKDGRALEIPVVSRINVDPALAALDINTLHLTAVSSSFELAEANAASHRAGLTTTGAEITKGANFLCVGTKSSPDLSCQVASPYANDAALVVYCDAMQCEMPVLARDAEVSVSATWDRSSMDALQTGVNATNRIQQIYDFLALHS